MPRVKRHSKPKRNESFAALSKLPKSQLATLASIELSRGRLAEGLGQTYGGTRDLYQTLGYTKTLTWIDYERKFTREGIAKRVVTAFPDATWRGTPEVYEIEDSEVQTKFEIAWKEMVERLHLFSTLIRADRLAGIGQYAVLFMGFDDGQQDPIQPVTSAKTLLYLQPYSQNNASVDTLVKDSKSDRYGLPETYKLKMQSLATTQGTMERVVHWSRVIHLAEGLSESNVFGTPRLEPVFNYLENLEKVVGGSAEMFWRGANKDLALEMESDAEVEDATALNDEIDDYIHNLRRVLRLKGIKAKSLAPAVADPESHVNVQLKMISGTTGIPTRILTGSERGELASSQDRANWNDRVDERRESFAEPFILRVLIDRLIEFKVLPKPAEKNGYSVKWPIIEGLTEQERMDIGALRTKALKDYMQSGAEAVVGPLTFLTRFLGFEDKEAEAMVEEVSQMLKEEEAEMSAAEKIQHEADNGDEDEVEEKE